MPTDALGRLSSSAATRAATRSSPARGARRPGHVHAARRRRARGRRRARAPNTLYAESLNGEPNVAGVIIYRLYLPEGDEYGGAGLPTVTYGDGETRPSHRSASVPGPGARSRAAR